MHWRSLAFLVLTLGLCAPPASAQQEQVFYYHLDAIGSVRMITDANGQVVERHDYLPFGQEWLPPPSTERRLFTGTERDSETTFDYLGARYYTFGSGRFTTVDPDHVAGDIFNPQTWNGYAYALNNPLRYLDPDGYESECPANTIDTGDGCTDRVLFDLSWHSVENSYLIDTSSQTDLNQLNQQMGPQRTCFAENFSFAWRTTNSFFFKGPGRLSRTAMGSLTAGAMARSTGLTTFGMAARDLLQGEGVANLGFRGTLISIGANSLLNAVAVTAVLETGITVGAGVDAAYETFIAHNCK